MRLITRIPARLRLADISSDGTALLIREELYRRVNVMSEGDAAERDLSWFDFTQARDISADGHILLFEESGAAVSGRSTVFLRSSDGSGTQRLGDGRALALFSR